jgi:hypothetical protein
MRRSRRIAVAGGLLLVLATVIVSAPDVTLASWSDTERGTGSMAAGTLNPPGTLSCSGGGLLAPVTFSWAAPAGGANVIAPTGYHWTLVSKALLGPTGSGDVLAPAQSVTIPSAAILAAGSSTFTVTATGPGGWTSAPGPTGTMSVISVVLGLLSGCSVP